ncbi:tetraspanin, partial [Elysia marginata]
MGLKCSQCSLLIINSVFAMMGLTLFIIGCLVRFGSDTMEEFFADRISGTWNFMRSAGSEGNMENFDLSEYIASIAYLLIGGGGFFIFVSFFGCCGGIGKIRCCLIFYAICVCLLLLVELALVILVLGFPNK